MALLQKTPRFFRTQIISMVCIALMYTAVAESRNGGGGVPAPWVGKTLWDTPCKAQQQGYGPYDYLYRGHLHEELDVVERYHFGWQVESLQKGMTTTNPLSDLNYTLRAWPNHHRALNTAIRARLQVPKSNPKLKFPPAECYLQRAINFSPKDATSHMLYGILLARMDEPTRALEAYNSAESLSPNDPQIIYNKGLLLEELGRYQEARAYADRALEKKYPFKGLDRKLKAKGH